MTEATPDPSRAIDNRNVSRDYALPLVIAVTGHRDLASHEMDAIRARVRVLFRELQEQYPDNRLTVMSPLAEGADMLAAEVALDLGIELIVPLPKPKAAYLNDFMSDAGKQRFEALCLQAKEVFELSYTTPPVPAGFDPEDWEKSYPYSNLGIFLCSHCHILLAIWDGKETSKLGGTGQVVRFHHKNYMPGLTPPTAESLQMLVDDESDLVFHISCSRDEASEPTSAQTTPDWNWWTQDADSPLSKELPSQHKIIFQRSAEFSADALKFTQRIEQEKYPLLDHDQGAELPAGLAQIDHLYCIADWLAIHYQKKSLRSLTTTHVMAFLMGLMFIFYSDLESRQILLLSFLGFFSIATLSQLLARRGAWHRRYLDYRVLAEGLRVQFYWAAAGVASAHKWKFAHDNYLQSQNPEFGWIRNVMRVAGIRCDARPNANPSGIAFTLREWVGGPDRGQLGYFRRQTHKRMKRFELTERLGKLSLVVSVLTVFAFLFAGMRMNELTQNIFTVVMGSTLLLYGIREGFTYATGSKELIKQFQFMLRIFDNAHRRLSETQDSNEQRLILSALGQSALDENSNWILMHRERSLDESEVWRMGS